MAFDLSWPMLWNLLKDLSSDSPVETTCKISFGEAFYLP